MKLYAISDLHLEYPINREAFRQMPHYPDDWLILAGDIAESKANLQFAFEIACERFSRVLWVPGNHELWVRADSYFQDSGEKYDYLISLCHSYGILTPEDPYPLWGEGEHQHRLVPLFLLYDYSFRPADVREEEALDWAMASGVVCRDEALLKPASGLSKQEWCQKRLKYTESRLLEGGNPPLVLINHFPLREDLIRLKKIPRFSIWCGTKQTEQWHTRYPVAVVVSGHLHMSATDYRDGVRFEEVSLGYPNQWNQNRDLTHRLREILPGPPGPAYHHTGPFWRWEG